MCQADHLSRGFLLGVVCQTEYDHEALRVRKRTWLTRGLLHSGKKKIYYIGSNLTTCSSDTGV